MTCEIYYLRLTSVVHSLPVFIKFCLLVNIFTKVRSRRSSTGPPWRPRARLYSNTPGHHGTTERFCRCTPTPGALVGDSGAAAVYTPDQGDPEVRKLRGLRSKRSVHVGDEVSVNGGEGYSANDSTHFQSVMVKRLVVSHPLKSSLHRNQISRANAARAKAGQVLIEPTVYW